MKDRRADAGDRCGGQDQAEVVRERQRQQAGHREHHPDSQGEGLRIPVRVETDDGLQ